MELWNESMEKGVDEGDLFFDLKQSEGWWRKNPAAGTVKTTANDGIFAYQPVSQQQ